jgi:lactoylglutathione lyase
MPEYQYDHIHLISQDPDKTAEFYIENFGAKAMKRMSLHSGRASIFLDLKGAKIIVSNSLNENPILGFEHFGFTTDNIEASVTELKAKGVKFQMEITSIGPGIKVAYFWAPENVLVELVEDKV